MPPKRTKKLLKDTLENLSEENFKKFCHELKDREEEPRVPLSRIEGKDVLDVTDVMVSTFTEKEALKVAVELLREVGCNQDAEKLAKEGGLQSPAVGSTEEEHFVDKHRNELIQRVSNVNTTLDQLLKEKVIQPEAYDEIWSKPTSQAKMRAILDGPMRSSRACKEILYKILKEQEPFLIQDLEGN